MTAGPSGYAAQAHEPHPHEDHWFRRAARHVPRPLRLAIGAFLVLAGIAMLVLPGPGLLTIFVGVQVLALDVPVAARAERAVLRRLKTAAERARTKRATKAAQREARARGGWQSAA